MSKSNQDLMEAIQHGLEDEAKFPTMSLMHMSMLSAAVSMKRTADTLDALLLRKNKKQDARKLLLEACCEFVKRVEAGEIRSVHTYSRMKAAIEAAALEDQEG